MTSVTPISLSENYADSSPSARDKINAATLDSDHISIATKINDQLLPALAQVIRDDDTLVDGIVRSRNLHPEVSLLIASKSGWQPKADVQAASLANINLSAPGATIDGRNMVSGDRFLAKNQTDASQNGIYVWNGAAVAATRATDADTSSELGYAFVSVAMGSGTSQVGTSWVCNQSATDISSVGVTVLSFCQVGANLIGNAMRPVVLSATLAAARAAMGPWTDQVGGVSVRYFGAVGDGIVDDTSAIQAAHSSGAKKIIYPPGTYKITSTITVYAGQMIEGSGGSPYSPNSKIVNNTVGGKCFQLYQTGGSGVEESFSISDILLVADFPIVLNDRTGPISNGSSQPYLMQFRCVRCGIYARSNTVGYGIQLTKVFDWVIEQCDIGGFSINVILAGCDIGTLRDCRINAFNTYGILEFGTSTTFGSQNRIWGNDILLPLSSSAVFFKSSALHVSFIDNYLECGSAISGYVDVTKTGMPAIFGSNVSADTFTCRIENNRIDGHYFATSFIYRVANNMLSCVVSDRGTTGSPNPTLDAITIENGNILSIYGTSHRPEYRLFGESFGLWSGFYTHGQIDLPFTITPGNFASLSQETVVSNNAGQNIRISPEGIIYLTGLTGFHYIYPKEGVSGKNELFANGVTYTVTVTARTTHASGDTLNVGRLLDGAGGAMTAMSLTQQFKEFTFSFAGDVLTKKLGLYANRTTFNGNIIIRSIQIK